MNLSAIENACAYLESRVSQRSQNDQKDAKYLAYLYEQPSCQHSFYLAAEEGPLSRKSIGNRKTLQDIIQSNCQTSLSMPNQLRTAIQLIYTVLQFHSTPWLRESWNTADILVGNMERIHSENIDLFLRSGFFSQISENFCADLAASLWDRKGKGRQTVFEPKHTYDINNMTLFSLGVALLEIGHWTPLSQMRSEGDPDDLATAIRMAQQRTFFGKSYNDIVRMCMQCHFGFGHDLSKVELQSAVYNGLICRLEEMVKILDG